ncbi:erythromycin esterase family protein [Marinilabiliaceae bacterium ANBcel2]|nr:erythromycin esterase family protein [Marinilabiliaceae bacterium ANBcel2]
MKNFIITAVIIFLVSCSGDSQNKGQDLNSWFKANSTPFETVEDLSEITSRASNRSMVLLGEASHGTHEYYKWRAKLSKYLISQKQFNFIVVEGDWASIYRLNKYVKDWNSSASSAKEVLREFDRWPQWMWSNSDILSLAEWLREYNKNLNDEDKVGFYGMDVYGQWQALDDLLVYTEVNLPNYHDVIKSNLNCFTKHGEDEWDYARFVAQGGSPCTDELTEVAEILRNYSDRLIADCPKSYFRAKQNAYVVKNAESYYRLAVQNNVTAWNSRVDHMWLTVQRLREYYGENSKGILWAHNTHVGDSRATYMAMQGQYNAGRLSRDELGEDNVFILGFATTKGRVNAGSEWGSAMQIMDLPDAQEGSLGHYMGRLNNDKLFLTFDVEDRENPIFQNPIGHRAVGVTYNPAQEEGNYVPSILPYRYDAILFIKETSELDPL